ncbi:GNAT family N-acetyltransferase [Rudaeicoccus suwonensis]|uniref:N-acetyltransferase domain-containing protein n=1 Tax=Rudaeicoccus suwonensis TaxID=657409 RepID=A0A561EAW0_9MICO|nr:GNAT family N-acetyltransferase [Rudaeicoccus suwonensis]TWE12755.1 hypothetical protein BKA23_1573 [Rudaeicoccus suwonensis]
MTDAIVAGYVIRALTDDTWDAFARMVDRTNGIFGGCWCTWFHTMSGEKTGDAQSNRDLKRRLVAEGRAHAALVFDGEDAVAWCEYGSVDELPNIYHRKQYEQECSRVPNHRLTCIYVDKKHRKRGLSAVALQGAVDLIAAAGGGRTEGYPQDLPEGKRVSASFLYNGTRRLFEQVGFTYDRPKGQNHCVMVRDIAPAH